MDKIRLFTRTLLTISLCAGLTLTSSAFAADAVNDHVAAMIKAMDTNHDGMVSKAEFLAYAKAQFDAMDTNHDGQVTVAEMDAARMAKLKIKTPVALLPASATIIKPMDSNNDGIVSAEEHATAAEKDFNAMDANHDGQLSADEMRVGYDAQVRSVAPAPGMY
ncbi:MAG TPA: EF-hand domain-containing protein [Xanthomonadaceae bacterium]|nr:EF-hand domain-containing protein [Xanthomonadaceae bacterium]